jgi:hypothetical protein
MNRALFTGIIMFTLFASHALSQDIYLTPSHEVYAFLKRMEARQLLMGYKDAAKPLSRITIAKMLKTLEPQVKEMIRVERENYEFFVTEFKYELLKLANDPQPSELRWHLLSYDLTDGHANLDINYKLSSTSEQGKSHTLRSQGLTMYGYTFNDVGFSFQWIDNLEHGDNINFDKTNTPDQGITLKTKQEANTLEYNAINAQLSWKIGAFDFSIEKAPNVWGYGKSGGIILSEKAPSFPQIKMRVPLSKNIDFIYIHGELNSNVIDSSRSYTVTYSHPFFSTIREVDHSKYIAAHMIEFSLFNGVDLSLGESVIYSDRGPLFIYLIPVMFFKAAEHYNRDADNTQIFGTLDLNVIRNINFTFSLFIDELNTDQLFDPNKSRRQLAFSSGLRLYDIPIDNMELYVEYTRANPWVYNHKYPATTFTNNGYDLGSWIGQNADDLFWEALYTPLRQLKIGLTYEVYRKGAASSIYDQYQPDGGKLPFLFGLWHQEHSVGIFVKYQPLRDIFFDFRGKFRSVQDAVDPSQNRNNTFEAVLSAGLGVW